jgi:hypothetical protein
VSGTQQQPTDEAAIRAYIESLGQRAQRDQSADRAALPGWAASALSGATFGFGDEITAGARSLFGGTPYNEALTQERANLERFRARNPLTAAGTELAGSLPTMLIPMGWAMRLARAPAAGAAAVGATAGGAGLRNAARIGAITGAAGGALQGAGEGEGIGGRLGGAATGGALGAGAGAAAGPILQGIAQAAPRVAEQARRLTGLGTDDLAMRDVARIATADDVGAQGPRAARAATFTDDELARAGMPVMPETLAERLGPNARGRLEAMANAPGPGMARIVAGMTERQGGRIDRVDAALRTTFGDLADARLARADTYTQRSAEARPLYQQAFDAAGPLEPRDLDLLSRVPGSAVREAEQYARIAGEPFRLQYRIDDAGRFIPDALPTAEDMARIRTGLRIYIENNTRDGRPNSLGVAAQDLYRQLTRRLDEVAPGHAAASRVWADHSAVLDAMELGQNLFRLRPNQSVGMIRREIAQMPENARDGFLTGAMTALRDQLGQVRDTAANAANPINRIFSNRSQREALEVMTEALGLPAAEGQARFRQLAQMLEREARGVSTEATMLRNSATARRQAFQDAAGIGGAATGGGLLGMLGGLDLGASALAGAGSGLLARSAGERIADATARMLASTDPAEQRRLLGAITAMQRQLRQTQSGAAPLAIGRAGFVAGQQPGPLE